MYSNDKPGLGIDINEAAAAKYPIRLRVPAVETIAGWMAALCGRDVSPGGPASS